MDSLHEPREGLRARGDAPIAHARLLGAFTLVDGSGAGIAGAGRKVRALLAYLLLAEGRAAPRRELMAFAWSDRAPEQASASLRQALHEARRLFPGEPPLVAANRDAVRIEPGRVETDVGRLVADARAGRLAELTQGLQGVDAPLLADLDGIDAHIDQWLAEARRHWAQLLDAEVAACVACATAAGRSKEAAPLAAFLARRAGPAVPRRRWPVLAATAVAVAGLALGVGLWLRASQSDDILLVEPLQAAASDPAAQLIRTGLSGDLARVMVGRPAGLRIAQASGGQPETSHPQLTLTGAADTMGAALQVHLQLSDSRTHAILWSQNFAGPPADAEALRERAATKIGSVLDCALSTRHRGVAPVGEQPTILYLKACDLIGDYDLEPALDLLRQVTVQAPGFARAWADVAVTEALSLRDATPAQRAAAYADADSAAERALRIDPHTGLAYYAMAQTRPGAANWPRRMAIITQGLQVEPDGSELNNAMGQELLRIGRSHEGLDYLERSIRFDPLNPSKTSTLIPMLAFYGRVDDSEALAAKALELWPHSPMIWNAVFSARARGGDARKALVMLRDPNRAGMRTPAEAARWTATLRARIDPSPANVDAAVAEWTALAKTVSGQDPLPVALTLSRLGRTDLAYRLLAQPAPVEDRATEGMFRDGQAAFRADPGFMTLAARRGLVTIWRTTDHWPDFCSAPAAPRDCRAEATAR